MVVFFWAFFTLAFAVSFFDVGQVEALCTAIAGQELCNKLRRGFDMTVNWRWHVSWEWILNLCHSTSRKRSACGKHYYEDILVGQV